MEGRSLPILSIMVAVPFIAALWCAFARGDAEARAKNARITALVATLLDFGLGVGLWHAFDIGGPRWQFVEKADLFGRFSWALGIDGIALMLIMLTLFLTPICVIASWKSINKRVPEYMTLFLIGECLTLAVFMAQDIFLFYLLFESTLIPMYLIIGIWGGPRRFYAGYKFFIYTLLGSVLMFIAILYMVRVAHTSSIPLLLNYNFDAHSQRWLWFAFLASFAVKLPMWPFHTWLPDAHVEAPTAGSVILAGIMLKLGGYGFIRFVLPMLPDASAHYMWLIFALSMIASVYTSLAALVQEDMKKLIAYSSVAHMAIVTFGLFSFNEQGLEGGLMLMLGHGLVSSALFLCVGVVYDRLHTRDMSRYGGLTANMPNYALFFMFFTAASIGIPGLANFVGEFLAMMGTYHQSSWAGVVATLNIIFSSAYMFWLYRRVLNGPQINADAAAMPDLELREIVMLLPMVFAVLWMGVYPESFIAPMRADVLAVLERTAHAAPPGDAAMAAGRATAPAATTAK